MALSESQRKANDKYIAANYKQVKLSMPKEEAKILDDFCKERNRSKAGLIREAIKEKMERIIEEEKNKKDSDEQLLSFSDVCILPYIKVLSVQLRYKPIKALY